MNLSKLLLWLEFFVLFVLVPLLLVIPFHIWIKVGLVATGFVYVLFQLKNAAGISFSVKRGLKWRSFWRRIAITFIVVAVATTVFVWMENPTALFFVPKNNPLLYLAIIFIYTLLSVWPQEIIYRTFFFERYEALFNNKALFVFVNAIAFSLAHLFFRNILVLLLTFIGGILFGYTYLKYNSTTAVAIEHALYGNWLFTIGMGQMLAFPGMD